MAMFDTDNRNFAVLIDPDHDAIEIFSAESLSGLINLVAIQIRENWVVDEMTQDNTDQLVSEILGTEIFEEKESLLQDLAFELNLNCHIGVPLTDSDD